MSRSRVPGFTIIELMIVVLIVAILATVVVPLAGDFVVRNRLKTAVSDLHMSLLFARSEAIKRNENVTLAPNDGDDWASGWEVRDAAGTVLNRRDAYGGLAFATYDAAYNPAAVTEVTYAGSGRESASGGAGVAFVLTAAGYPSIAARCVTLAPSGRPNVRVDSNGDDSDGC
jgi:type IV fimbrial biogenesis protein FimT